MHKESFDLMRYFVQKYLDGQKQLDILVVGSYDVNGAYRSLFENSKWKYTGLDLTEGPNVDIISNSEYDFGIANKYDVVISGNCMEHVEAPWKWIKEIEKVIKKDGLICIITPFSIGEHKYPVDCWRILPDGYRYLLEEISDFKLLESKINNAEPIIKYKIFNKRQNLNWLFKITPNKIKNILAYKVYGIKDTIAIGRKN